MKLGDAGKSAAAVQRTHTGSLGVGARLTLLSYWARDEAYQ